MNNPLTTSSAIGVTTRDIVVVIGAVIAVLGALGLIDEEQRQVLTEQAPALMTALGSVITVGMMIYRAMTKSMSDRASEVGKETDASIPASQPVVIETPAGRPNIVVAPTKV